MNTAVLCLHRNAAGQTRANQLKGLDGDARACAGWTHLAPEVFKMPLELVDEQKLIRIYHDRVVDVPRVDHDVFVVLDVPAGVWDKERFVLQ